MGNLQAVINTEGFKPDNEDIQAAVQFVNDMCCSATEAAEIMGLAPGSFRTALENRIKTTPMLVLGRKVYNKPELARISETYVKNNSFGAHSDPLNLNVLRSIALVLGIEYTKKPKADLLAEIQAVVDAQYDVDWTTVESADVLQIAINMAAAANQNTENGEVLPK